MSLPHDTPVDLPRVELPASPARRKPKQELEWEEQAAALKADGYNAAVVARKMIEVHGMPEVAAESLVSQLFGRNVNARAGDTASAVVSGLLLAGVGLGGALVFFLIVGTAFLKLTFVVYLALLGLAGKGATQAFIALVNADTKEPLQK